MKAVILTDVFQVCENPFEKMYFVSLNKEMPCIYYVTVLRSMEETIIFNVVTSYKIENIYSMSYLCVVLAKNDNGTAGSSFLVHDTM
jgi:hypothetical protein